MSKNKNLNPRKYEYLSLKDDFFHSTQAIEKQESEYEIDSPGAGGE